MPSRYVIKTDVADNYYHVFARGGNRQRIFLEPYDFEYFLGLFPRYLSLEPQLSQTGPPYPHLHGRLELLCYCLMTNHFHLLVYQNEQGTLARLMRSIMTSYSVYFNKKYQRSGPVFETTYKAVLVGTDAYMQHISRYIHLNPDKWFEYPYSSLQYYVSTAVSEPEWLQTERVRNLFRSASDYVQFIKEYENQRAILKDIKHQLADR